VTMERVREAITSNAELADESTWLWLTSEQTSFPLRPTGGGEHEERPDKKGSKFMRRSMRWEAPSMPTSAYDPGLLRGGCNFLKKQECWEGHEQALISTIWKETKRTEELEEAENR